MNKERELLPVFDKIQMATIYHFQPWTSKTAKSLKASLLWPTVLIDRLRKQELITNLVIYPYASRYFRHNTFYAPKKSIHKAIAIREIEHQSGLIDVLMAFIYSYPDYDVSVRYQPRLKAGGMIYRPDALVKMTDRNLKGYHFLIEFERTRGEEAIYREKLLKNEAMSSFKALGLSPHTKILYIYAYERFNVFWRPIQYGDQLIADVIKIQNKKFHNLIRKAKDLPDHKYRFLPYHQFTHLAEPVWITPKGRKVSLLS